MEILSSDEGTKKDGPQVGGTKGGNQYLGILKNAGLFYYLSEKIDTGRNGLIYHYVPKILVFSSERISDLRLDLAGLLKKHLSSFGLTILQSSVPAA